MKATICTSCGTKISTSERFVKFNCPNCAKTEVVRCSRCKTLMNEYTCGKCKFVGP